MTFTPDINLGNIIVTTAIGAVVWLMQRLYRLVAEGIDTHKQALEDLDDHAEVINLHTDLFVDKGIVDGPIGLPRVTERRKRPRVHVGRHHLGLVLLAASLTISCGGALKGGTIGGGNGLPRPLPAAGVAFDLVWCASAVADNYCTGAPGALFTLTPLGVSNPPRVELGDSNGYTFVQAIPATWTLINVAIAARGFEPFAFNVQTADLIAANAAGRHNFYPAKSSVPPMPDPPSRAEILNVGLTFQGLTVECGAPYGSLPWFEASLAWLPADCRQAAYAAKRASRAWGPTGDTHALVFLPSGPPLYDEPGQPYDRTHFPALDWTDGGTHVDGRLANLIAEVAQNGFRSMLLFLGGDDGQAGYPIAMAQLELVHDALINTPYGDLRRYVVVLPGFDGVFYGYSPDQVAAYGAKCRALFFYCGVEHQPGRIPVGEGGGDYQTGGRMTTFDLVLAEFDGPLTSDWRRTNDGGDSQGRPNYRGNQIWQIGGRMLGPQYRRPTDQPDDADGPSPPFYLAPGSARGPFVHCAFEWVGLYLWVRGRESAADIIRDRQYFQSAGWSCGG